MTCVVWRAKLGWAGWGSTRDEQHRALPGDDIVAAPTESTTHAITIDASVDAVWPWLVQMGYGRAGWYTPSWVDRLWRVKNPSATHIDRALQHLAVDDTILDGPPGTATFRVRVVEPPHALVLHSQRHPVSGVPPNLSASDPGLYLDFSWAFVLESAGEKTRLLLRTRSIASRNWLRVASRTVFHPADVVLGRFMLKAIRRRAESGGFTAAAVPHSRRVVRVASKSTRRDAATGLFECDVTEVLHRIDRIERATGEKLSLTAFLCHAVAAAVAEQPAANSCRDLRNRVITFADVDLLTMVETSVEGRPLPIGWIIRRCDKKTVEEIHAEIRQAQIDPMAGQAGTYIRWGRWIPTPLLSLIIRLIDRNPLWTKRIKGTVSLSAIGMFGDGGWGMSGSHHTVSVIVGGITKRPVFGPEGIEEREFLGLTLSIDHNLIDGAPAARLARNIQARIQRAEGIPLQPPARSSIT